MDTQQSAAKVLAHKVRPFLGWWKKSLGNVALTQARTIVGSLPFVISTFVAGVASGDVIDFEGLGLLEGDPVPIIDGVTFSGDIAIQGSPAFGFGVNFGGDDAGNAPPFSNAGNVFITNPGGFASPETVKIVTFEFATPVTNLSFLVADIDFCPVNDLRERLVADVFDQDGNLLACVIFEGPLGGNGGDGDVVLIDFGAVTGIVALETRVDFSVGSGFEIGFGIDNLSFTTAAQGITIDATALSSQLMNLFAIGNFNSNTITTFELDPGTYSLSGAFAFQVTGSGVLEYDVALDGFVSGRGTKTLTILGYAINFDATALSSQLMNIFAIGNFNSGTLTTFTLIPGIYTISGADTVIVFQLTDSGALDFDTALEGFVAGLGSDTLTILGYDVTFDLTALSPQLVNIFSIGNFNTDTPTTFTLIPGLATPSVEGDTFSFTLTNDGMISGLPSTFQGLPLSVSGTSLIISGLGQANETAKLTASDPEAGDRFGDSAAVSGDVAVIGAWQFENPGPGKAYVYRFNGTDWIEEAKLIASDAVGGDDFGFAVAITGDVAVIGARQFGTGPGKAYVYRFNGTDWIEEAKLTASVFPGSEEFGFSASISGDVVIIGDRLAGGGGAAWVYRYDGTDWIEEAKLIAFGPTGRFGQSVSISGNVAVVGAYLASPGGAAYVYRYDGTDWIEEAKLTASDAAGGDWFGNGVTISGDVIVIGSPRDDDGGTDSGSAYVYRFNGTDWIEDGKLTASDAAAVDFFGSDVSISGDVIIIGTTNDDDAGQESGSAYLFKKPAGGWTDMTESAKLTASDAAAGDAFGSAVAISGDMAVIGALFDDEGGFRSGSAYVFDVSGLGLIDIDTDGDGLLNSTEVDIAMGSGCPDPGNADSDGDTLSDGFEILTLGTNPCNSDTDGDGVPDNTDDLPTEPGVTSGFLEDASRDLGTVLIPQLDLNVFNGTNNNANQGRRGALANRANEAANLIATGDIQGAVDKLTSLLEKIDGQSPPPDWMDDSPEKDALAADVDLLILLLLLL